MVKTLRLLHLEDIRSDADLIKREVEKAGLVFDWLWLSSRLEFKNAVNDFRPDVILCDHSLSGFNSVEAFKMVKESGLKIPFILVTATISEEFAVMMMKEGIADYLLKDRIQRLPGAILNALEKWEAERHEELYLEEIILNEKRFRGLIENSSDLIILCDEKLTLTYSSPNLSRITGWNVQEIENSSLIFYIHSQDRQTVQDIIQDTLTKPSEYFPLSCRFRNKDDRYLFLDGSAINLMQEESIKGIVLNMRDITQRKMAEESLQRSEANLTAIIENSDASVYSLDKNFRYLTFNTMLKTTLKQVYGLDIHEGDQVFDFLNKLDPEEAKEWETRYTMALSGKSMRFIKEFKVGDYHSFTSFSINPILENDNVTGLSCFARDITLEKLADEKIKQNEARFRALIENNYDAITVLSKDLSVIYRSPASTRILGYSEESSGHNLFAHRIHSDDIDEVKKLFQSAIENPDNVFHLTCRVKHFKGHYIWTECVVRNMLHNDSVKGIIVNYRDVTERKEFELQRENMTSDLIQRNKDLEQFAYIVSHNLRAPVANMLGIADLLEDPESRAIDNTILIEGISFSVRRLDEVIRDLNHILQVRREIDEKKQIVHFQDLVDDIRNSILSTFEKSHAKIMTDFSDVESMSTIKSYLYSIFYNLISNSIKFRRPNVDPVIEIWSNRLNDKIKFFFRDNGIGIDMEAQGSNVFGLYKRFHPEIEGKGMGLFMTKTHVQSLGGTIQIRSEVDKGTEFIILL